MDRYEEERRSLEEAGWEPETARAGPSGATPKTGSGTSRRGPSSSRRAARTWGAAIEADALRGEGGGGAGGPGSGEVAGGVSEQLGLEMRRLREEGGLTVEELAEKSGISASTIRAVERGTREARGDTVAKLAKPLGLTFDEVWRLQRRRG